jgi:hypothetical protein
MAMELVVQQWLCVAVVNETLLQQGKGGCVVLFTSSVSDWFQCNFVFWQLVLSFGSF